MIEDSPATLADAIATEPLWLQVWVVLLVLTHLASVGFIVGRGAGHWRFRPEPLAILLSFILAAIAMDWIFSQVGYVRLLGLAHLICWGPVWTWIAVQQRRKPRPASAFDWYLWCYLVIAGISLIIDIVDVIRYVLGDPG